MALEITEPKTPEMVELLRLIGGLVADETVQARITTLDTVVDGIQTDLDNGTDGLGALKTLVDTVDTVVDGIQTDLSNGTDGLGALKTLVDTVDAVVDGIQTDLDNGTDGLGALKALIDTVDGIVDTILVDTAELQSDWTDGGRLDLILDAIVADTAELQTDWANGGRLDLILDELTSQGDTNETKLDTIDTVVDGIQTDLSNSTDGLGALKDLVDGVSTLIGSPVGADIVADLVSIKSDTTNISNVVKHVCGYPTMGMEKPESGATPYIIELTVHDNAGGGLTDPDSSEVFFRLQDMAGATKAGMYFTTGALDTAITAEASGDYTGWYKMPKTSIGKYYLYAKINNDATLEALSAQWEYIEGTKPYAAKHTVQVVDLIATQSGAEATADQVWEETIGDHSGTAGSTAKALADALADTNELQTDFTNGGRLDLILDAIVADSNELQTDWVDGGRLDLLLDAALADTNELQTDWTNGGRLDLILDELTAQGDTNEGKLDVIDTVVDGIQTDLSNGTDGLGALKALIDTVDGVVDGIQTDLSNETDGLGALKALIDTVDGIIDTILVDTAELQTDWTDGGRLDLILDELTAQGDTNEGKLDTIDTVVDGIQTDLSNSTDGLGALKTLIDSVQTTLDAEQLSGTMFKGAKSSASLAQGAAEVVALSTAEGFDCINALVQRIKISVTGASSEYKVEIFEDSGATKKIWQGVDNVGDDIDLLTTIPFYNQNGTPDKNIYVKITNTTDAGTSAFAVELRGEKKADSLA